MEADDDWVVLSDGDGSSGSPSDDGSDCGFVRVRKGGGGDRRRSVVVRDATPPTVAAAEAVPQPTTLQQGPFAVISYREAFSASSPGDGGSCCERSDLFDGTKIREALFGAGCSSQGAGAGKEDCECQVGEHGGTSGGSVQAPPTPSVPAADAPPTYPLPSAESETTVSHGEAPSGVEEEDAGSSGEEVGDGKDAGTSGEEVEDEMDAGTSSEEEDDEDEDEDEDLHHSSKEHDDGMESFGGEKENDVDEYSDSCSEETESFGEDEDDDDDACTESCSEEGDDDDEYMQSCSGEENDDTESFSEEEEDGVACTGSEEEDDRCYYDDEYTESCSEQEDDDDYTESLLGEEEEDDDEYTESCSEEEDDAESSGEEAVMEEESSSHIADCEHQGKLQATGNKEPLAFPVNKYDDIDDSESDDESKYGYIDIIPSPPRRADTIGYCKTACIACGGLQLGAAIEVEKELLDFCPCKYDGIRTGISSGMGEGSLEYDEQRGSAENVELSELFSKILEMLESDEEDETSSTDTEQSDSDEDDGVDSSDADESGDEEEPVGISYDDIDCSEEEDDGGEEEEEDQAEEDEEEHGFDVVDAAVVAQRDVAGLDVPPARVQERPPGQRRAGSPTADLTFLVVVYLLVYLAFSYIVTWLCCCRS